jgi:hypothetical protein
MSLLVGSLILAGAATASAAQTSTGQASSEADPILAAYLQSVQDAAHGSYVEASFGLLSRLRVASAAEIDDPDVFDQWAQVMSTMTGRPTFNPAKSADFEVPPQQVVDLRAADAVSAIPEIVRRAQQTSIVIVDENHLDPRGRAFGLEVARALRPLGYTVLAVEALKRDADNAASLARSEALAVQGYPRQSNGYYLDDPVFADFIRQSLALGYRPVSYEATRTDYSEDAQEAQGQREQDQADNLIRRALGRYPGEKILIYVGEHHIAERPIAAEGGKVMMMAERLRRATGIDPLTIDQAGLSPVPMNRPNLDLNSIAETKAGADSVVLMHGGEPLVVGLLAGSVDLQVVHPRAATVYGRPDWLFALGRKPTPIPQNLLPTSGSRLVQAFLATEALDAIPIDQVLVHSGATPPMLFLPSSAVRYAFQQVP